MVAIQHYSLASRTVDNHSLHVFDPCHTPQVNVEFAWQQVSIRRTGSYQIDVEAVHSGLDLAHSAIFQRAGSAETAHVNPGVSQTLSQSRSKSGTRRSHSSIMTCMLNLAI